MDRYPQSSPPEAWLPIRRIAERLLRPLERFLRVEAASGIVLLVAVGIALAWANSPLGRSYEHMWHTPVTVGIGRWVSARSLLFWVNDGLMTVFFLVVGLEIRREIHEGELSDVRRAALPVAAAVGGMVVPALLYLLFNRRSELRRGWGVPMATDIAFAVGVLAMLGNRIPSTLRVLLLALAIIDDIGAVVVIAVFYSSGVSWVWLLVGAGGALGILLFRGFGVRHASAYVLPGSVVWLGLFRAGVHPTIGGVLIGLLAPATPWFGREGFLAAAREAIDDFREHAHRHDRVHGDLLHPLRRIRQAQREALPPVVRVQTTLHPWVAFGIMPLFAFANAGIHVGNVRLDREEVGLTLGVLVGLVVGKPMGILIATLATVKLGICALPRGIGWRGVLVVGCVAGIGFTMAIFIASLAFPETSSLATVKLAVLVSSMSSAVIALVVGRTLF
jgi:NhaA family Na+:H+ antiporter